MTDEERENVRAALVMSTMTFATDKTGEQP